MRALAVSRPPRALDTASRAVCSTVALASDSLVPASSSMVCTRSPRAPLPEEVVEYCEPTVVDLVPMVRFLLLCELRFQTTSSARSATHAASEVARSNAALG
jgi:hypothetical protein